MEKGLDPTVYAWDDLHAYIQSHLPHYAPAERVRVVLDFRVVVALSDLAASLASIAGVLARIDRTLSSLSSGFRQPLSEEVAEREALQQADEVFGPSGRREGP